MPASRCSRIRWNACASSAATWRPSASARLKPTSSAAPTRRSWSDSRKIRDRPQFPVDQAMRLRAIELKAVDVPKSAEFLERTWGVSEVDSGGSTRYFRGTADHPYILSLAPASAPGVEAITFSCNTAEIEAMRERVRHQNIAQLDAP